MRSTNGTRVIGGRVYTLQNVTDKGGAVAEVAAFRRAGRHARIIKRKSWAIGEELVFQVWAV